MKNTMNLHSWDRYAKIYSLDIEKGRYRLIKGRINESIISTGFVKLFFFGKKLAFYKIDDEWWLQYKKLKFNINNPQLYFEIKYDGLITIIVAHFDQKRSILIDTNFSLFISRKIDPTHDSLDEESLNFVARLRALRTDWLRDKIIK